VINIVGYTRAAGENPPVPGWNTVDSGYLQAMGIPLLQGRGFAESDTAEAPRVALIDEFLARKYWPKGNAVGAQIRRGLEKMDNGPPFTVVGVARSVKVGDLAEQNPVGQVYFHYKQVVPRSMHLVVKTAGANSHVTAAIRREVLRADPELPIFDVRTMPERVWQSTVNRRAAMVLCMIFAGLALVLSAIGIYGVLAYTVTQRTREFGIRVALGAGGRDVVGMVVGQGLKLAGIGLLIGISSALLLTRLMTALLYQVKPTDPGVFAAVAAGLGAVALAASLIPSARALRIRPAVALRYE
jgi:predicted permease